MPDKPQKFMLLVHEKLFGGGSIQTFFIIESLVSDGYEVVLVSNSSETWLGKKLASTGINVKAYYNKLFRRAINPFTDLLALLQLITLIRREKPDVIIASTVKMMGLGSFAGWLCQVPLRVCIIRGEGAAPGSRMLKIIHLMEWFLDKLGTKFITVSEYIRDVMISNRIARSENVQAIYDGIPLQQFETAAPGLFRSQFNIPSDAFLVGMVGRLFCQNKRFDLFVTLIQRLCGRHPNLYGVLIGEGEDREALQRQIDSTGFADRIKITGYYEEMPNVYADLDLTILFSFNEGCPNTLLESSAAGKPVMADDICGNRELIKIAETGFIIAPGDLETAVADIETLISNPEQAKEMGRMGQLYMREKFDRNQQVQKLINTIKDMYITRI